MIARHHEDLITARDELAKRAKYTRMPADRAVDPRKRFFLCCPEPIPTAAPPELREDLWKVDEIPGDNERRWPPTRARGDDLSEESLEIFVAIKILKRWALRVADVNVTDHERDVMADGHYKRSVRVILASTRPRTA